MIHCYSLDLRVRVMAFVEAGHSCWAAARHLGLSDSCAIKPLQRQRPPGSGKLATHAVFLIATVEAKPDITMPDLAARLPSEHGVRADPAALSTTARHRRAAGRSGWHKAA
jgi:transposase